MTPARPAREIADQRALPETARLSLSETSRDTSPVPADRRGAPIDD
jgi:hypothetical protein